MTRVSSWTPSRSGSVRSDLAMMTRQRSKVGAVAFATWAVALHCVIVLAHGLAHEDLGIQLTVFQKTFAGMVIVSAPIVAMLLMWTGKSRSGFALLTLSMTGSLVFGVYYHYIVISSDHVAHLPAGDLQGLFRITALLLPVSEGAGVTAGLLGWSRG